MVYFILNSGAAVESSHCTKNHDNCWPDACSATWRRSSTVIDLPEYLVSNSRIVLSNASSPITQRNMFRMLPPLSVTSDWNSGEKTSILPTCESGTLM